MKSTTRLTHLASVLLAASACYSNVPVQVAPVTLSARTGAPEPRESVCSEVETVSTSTDETRRAQAGVLNNQAVAAARQRDISRAVALWQRAVEVDPTNVEAWGNLARAHEQQGENETALRATCQVAGLTANSRQRRDALQKASELRYRQLPEEATSQFRVGLGLAQQSRWEESRSAYDEAIRLAPNWGEPLFNRALVYEATSSFQESIADLRRYLVLEPMDPERPRILDKINALEVQQRGARRFSWAKTMLLAVPLVGGAVIGVLFVRDCTVNDSC